MRPLREGRETAVRTAARYRCQQASERRPDSENSASPVCAVIAQVTSRRLVADDDVGRPAVS